MTATAVPATHLTCDQCGTSRLMGGRVRAARAKLATEGWKLTRVGGSRSGSRYRDLCSVCANAPR